MATGISTETCAGGRRNFAFFLVAKSLWGATVTHFCLLGLNDTVLHTHFCEPSMTMTKRRGESLLHLVMVFVHARSKAPALGLNLVASDNTRNSEQTMLHIDTKISLQWPYKKYSSTIV